MPLRSYDPAIARWNRIDPVVHHSLSTYNAFDNNPVVYADPSGGNSENSRMDDNIFSEGRHIGVQERRNNGMMGGFGYGNIQVGDFAATFNGSFGNSYAGDNNRSGSGSLTLNIDWGAGDSGGAIWHRDTGETFNYDHSFALSTQLDPVYVNAFNDQSYAEGALNIEGQIQNSYGTTGNGIGFSLSAMRLNRLYYIRNVEALRDKFRIAPGLYDYKGGIAERTRIKHFVRGRMTPFPVGDLLNKYVNNAPKSATPRFWIANKWVNYGSKAAGVLGAAVLTYDAYGVYNYYTDPNGGSHVVHPGMFAADLVATGVLYYGGPIGWFAYGVYQIGKASYNGTIKTSEYKRDWNRTCFVAGTKVFMANGSTKNIEDVVKGDKILSVNMATMKVEQDAVLIVPEKDEKYNKIYMKYDNGKENISSAHHPFYVKGKGWSVYDIEMAKKDLTFEVKQIELGDIVFYYSNGILKETKITELIDLKEEAVMYNIKYVKKNNTFFANGILVHNRFINTNE